MGKSAGKLRRTAFVLGALSPSEAWSGADDDPAASRKFNIITVPKYIDRTQAFAYNNITVPNEMTMNDATPRVRQKEDMNMRRTLNDELFDRMTRMPHAMRGRMMEGPEGGPRTLPHRGFAGEGPRTLPFRGFESGEGPRTLPQRGFDEDEGPRTLPRRPIPGGRRMPGGACEGMRGGRGFEGMPGRGFEGMPGMNRGEGGEMPMPPRGGFHRGPQHGRRPFSRERALEVLVDSDDGMRQREISERLGIGASSTSEFIAHLERDGYVRREVDPDDARATRIVLTDVGRARAAELEDEREERMEALFGALTEDEKRELIRLLDKLMAGRAPVGEEPQPV